MGPVVGACIMTLLPEFLRVSKEIEPMLTGAILVLLVIFLPGGVLSIPERISSWTESVMKRGKGSPAEVR
jgi:branched-chain amino acid transport system permease protein